MRALFLGSKSFGIAVLDCLRSAAPSVEWAIVHPNEGEDPRSNVAEFQQYAKKNDLEFLLVSSRREADQIILNIKPDIIFLCGWYYLLDCSIINGVPLGIFGIHNSLLPKYRGWAPLVWSIINGDAEVGASVFRLGGGMDDGEILLQVRIANPPTETVGTILNKLEAGLRAALPDGWKRILDGTARMTNQDESAATYCGQRLPEDGRIDWTIPSPRIHDFIRAQTTPYPGAFTFADGRKITILGSEIHGNTYFGTPGQVLARREDDVLIACGNATAIRVLDAAVDGEMMLPRIAFPSTRLRLS